MFGKKQEKHDHIEEHSIIGNLIWGVPGLPRNAQAEQQERQHMQELQSSHKADIAVPPEQGKQRRWF